MMGFFVTVLVAGVSFGGPVNKSEISSTAKWAIHLDAEKFLASKIGRMFIDESANADLKKGLDVLRATIHFDPLKDVKSVTLYGDSYKKDGGVAVLKVRPNAEAANAVEKIIILSKTHEQISFGSRVIHKWIDEKKQKPSVLCFYSPEVTVAGGDVNQVKVAIDLLDGKKDGGKDNTGVMMPDADGFIVACARKDEGKEGPANATVLKNAEWLTVFVRNTGENVDIEAKLGANSEENAKQIEQMVRGIAAFLALSAEQNEAAADIGKALSVNIDKCTVGVNFTYGAEQLYKLIKSHKRPNQKEGQQVPKPSGNASDGVSGNQ
ncbi:MAG: hypothetical protein A2283_09545 [Lentisphaerae bacterium RIFOXYA12_FULL_48_11]|nr:MAG: hypothetical protein A2283_09545 [Lentisphaerae bacterium RIFOXYA12_FULL_48_11]